MIPTAETITFPAVEVVAITRLADELALRNDDAHVTDTVPSPKRPGRMVKVTAGGPTSRTNLTTSLRSVIVECWDDDRGAAADLAELAYGIAMATRGHVGDAFVRYVQSVGEPVFFPDPRTDAPRYQFTVSFALAGRAA